MYHLFKQTRIYLGEPYQGPTSYGMPAEFKTLKEAEAACNDFNIRNPVGWNIFDAVTKELVSGHLFHKE